MSEKDQPEEYEIQFKSDSRWLPIPGAAFRDKATAEGELEKYTKEFTEVRVAPRQPLYDMWNFNTLAPRLEGTDKALREVKKRGQAGAIAGWAIYKQRVEQLIGLALGEGKDGQYAKEPSYRSSIYSDLEAVGEMNLITQIDELWAQYPDHVPRNVILDLKEEWNENLSRQVGRNIPHSPAELTKEDIAESKKVTKELYVKKAQQSVDEEVAELERMKKEIEEKMKRLKG